MIFFVLCKNSSTSYLSTRMILRCLYTTTDSLLILSTKKQVCNRVKSNFSFLPKMEKTYKPTLYLCLKDNSKAQRSPTNFCSTQYSLPFFRSLNMFLLSRLRYFGKLPISSLCATACSLTQILKPWIDKAKLKASLGI